MDGLLSVALLLALAAPVGLAAAWFCTRGASAISSIFRTDQGLGWPHGVQEEEPVPWSWDRRPAVSGRAAEPPAVVPVDYRVGPGSARARRAGQRDR